MQSERQPAALGQTTMAASLPVVLASNQASIPVTANAGTNLNTSALALDATLTGGTQRSKLTDGSNNVGVNDSSTAASEASLDRLKVNAALRLLDTAQGAGTQLVAAKGDQTTGLWVNIKNTSVAVAATLAAETTKVIGTVNVAASQTIAVTQATAASLNAQVVGAVASAAANAGNPVKIGAVVTSSPSVLTNSNITDLQTNTRGAVYATLMDGTGSNTAIKVNVPADSLSNATNFLFTHGAGLDFDGTTWNRHRGNEEVTLLASAARTTTQTSADIVNYNGLGGLIVTLDMTVVGTGSVTVTINGKDSTSGKYRLLLTGAAVTTNVTNAYQVGPNMAAVANSVALAYLPRIIQIVVTANNANAASYSVGYVLVGR